MTERPDIVLDEHLLFLDDLRKLGETNMFGAGTYLIFAFNVTKREAREILKYWMETFTERNKGEDSS